MITYIFKDLKELAAHLRASGMRRREEAANAKPREADKLRAEAYAYESCAHVVEQTQFKDAQA